MPRSGRLTAREVERVLRAHGFEIVTQKGSDVKWRNLRTGKQVIVPGHGNLQLPIGTLGSIIEGSGIPDNEWSWNSGAPPERGPGRQERRHRVQSQHVQRTDITHFAVRASLSEYDVTATLPHLDEAESLQCLDRLLSANPPKLWHSPLRMS